MRNFKAKGSMVETGEQNRNKVAKSAFGGATPERDLSSDSDIEAFVDNGVHNAFTVAEKTVKDNFHPYAVSFLLSLSAEQLSIL